MDNTGLMRPGPTIAAAEDDERRRKEEGFVGLMRAILPALGMIPGPVGMVADVGYEVADKGWAKGLAAGAANLAMGGAVKNGPKVLKMFERAGGKINKPIPIFGKANRTLHRETGTFYDVEGNLLKEFSDDAAKPKDALLGAIEKSIQRGDPRHFQGSRLGELIDHPELFMRHPEMADTPVTVGLKPDASEYGGSFVPGRMKLIVPGQATADDPLLTLLHEPQHGIQHKQDLARGSDAREIERMLAEAVTHYGNPQATIDLKDQIKEAARVRYLLTEGELGARTTERRKPLTYLERRLEFPFDTIRNSAGGLIGLDRRVLAPYDQQAIDKIARKLLGIPEAP